MTRLELLSHESVLSAFPGSARCLDLAPSQTEEGRTERCVSLGQHDRDVSVCGFQTEGQTHTWVGAHLWLVDKHWRPLYSALGKTFQGLRMTVGFLGMSDGFQICEFGSLSVL